MELRLNNKSLSYLKSLGRRAEKIAALQTQWEEDTRIVRRMYEVIGCQNSPVSVSKGALEKSLEEIAEYVSGHEGRRFSIKQLRRIYTRVTAGNLDKEVVCAMKLPLEKIWETSAAIRRSNHGISRARHLGDKEASDNRGRYEQLARIFKTSF